MKSGGRMSNVNLNNSGSPNGWKSTSGLRVVKDEAKRDEPNRISSLMKDISIK